MKTKDLFFAGIILFVFLAIVSFAAPEEPDMRREQMRQEAQASYAEVSRTLNAILETVNRTQQPPETQIQHAAELLETNRRNAVSYDGSQKAVYMLLQSWVSYYQKDPVNNLNWAVRACREDPTNGDAWISQTLFSFIYGRRPIEPRPPRPQTEQRRQRPQPRGRQADSSAEMAVAPSADAPYGRPGTLDFDLNMIRRDFMRERFIRQEYNTADNKKVIYSPESDVLCILFWQAAEAVDPNTSGPRVQPQIGLEANTLPGGVVASRYTLETQQAYFKTLAEAMTDRKNVKFIEMNVNSAAVSKDAVQDYQPVAPLVIAALPQSGAIPFVRMDVPIPFLAIIDTGGQVKYAGVADGFVPAFILSHVTGAAIELSGPDAVRPAREVAGGHLLEMPVPVLPADPNRSVADPNQPRSRVQTRNPKQYRQLPIEQETMAETKLSVARDLYAELGRMPGMPYTRLVKECREIISTYPDTQYADEARKLLAQVPERLRPTYKITSEELGQ